MKKDKVDPALIRAVYKSYRNQRRILNELNIKLSQAKSEDEWISLFKQRSETIKVAFDVNTSTGALLSKALFSDQKLTYEYAETFFHEDFANINTGEHDDFFSCRVLETLASYYRNQHDLLRLLPLLCRLGNMYLSTVNMHFHNNYEKALKCFKEMLSFRENYSLIPDLSIRSLFFEAYYNLCCVMPIIETVQPIPLSVSLDYFLEVLAFYNSGLVQKIDSGSVEIRQWIERIKKSWLWIEYRIDSADPETKSAFLKVAHDVYSGSMKNSNNNIFELDVSTVLSYQHALILEGNTSYIDSVNYMLDYYHKKREKYASERKDDHFDLEEFYFETRIPISLIKWLDKIDILYDMCSRIRLQLIHEVNEYFTSLSDKKIFSHVIYEAACNWCFFVLKYMNGLKEKETFLINMLINRQPQTFFNAYLSADLAQMITASIYSLKPVLLTSVENYLKSFGRPGDIADVTEYIRKCALFHDIGINRLSRLEGIQFRALFESEIEILHKHTELGAVLFTDELSIYLDPVLGHHKYFDQSDGYPSDTDYSKSPVRIVCDIISICDALNASTDSLGRCYRKPKDFSIILSELITLSGTRYNTNLVNLFLDDMDLSCKVDALISYNREKTYYDYYAKYFDKKSE